MTDNIHGRELTVDDCLNDLRDLEQAAREVASRFKRMGEDSMALMEKHRANAYSDLRARWEAER